MAINKHGYKMKGLKAVAGETKELDGRGCGAYLELFYDRETGEVWTVFQWSLGQGSWTEYHDKSIIKITNICGKMTMQQIADRIAKDMKILEGIA